MGTAAIPTFDLSGTGREIGRRHGEAARAQIKDSVAFYKESFKKNAGLDWSQILELAPRWVPDIERYLPGITDELHGIAEGSGFQFAEVLALNARGELSYGNPFRDEEPNGCSSYAVLPEAASHGHTYCGQNWDWLAPAGPPVVTPRVTPPRKPTTLI